MCKLTIQQKPIVVPNEVGFAEITLYGTDGDALDRSNLEVNMSSTYVIPESGVALVGSNCIDGLLDDPNPGMPNYQRICRTRVDERRPRINVSYPCPSGNTSLSKVEVYQRSDCCTEKTENFTVGFVNAQGKEDLLRQDFVGVADKYTFMVPTPGE
jgi:hypothetical protein